MLGTQALLAPRAGAASFVTVRASGLAASEITDGPAAAYDTAATFMAIPSGPVLQGTPVILVVQVAPAHAAGTVRFMDGETELGRPQPVIDGFALAVTSKLTVGNHTLSAVFSAVNGAVASPLMLPPVLLTVIGLS